MPNVLVRRRVVGDERIPLNGFAVGDGRKSDSILRLETDRFSGFMAADRCEQRVVTPANRGAVTARASLTLASLTSHQPRH